MVELHKWVQSHQMTTFSELVSLQKYGSAIAMATLSLPKVIFPNRQEGDYDEMRFDGQRVTVQLLQAIFTQIQDEAVNLWENDVMLGLGLRVDYDILSDNLSSSTPGECFLDNVSNPFKNRANDMGNAIFSNRQLFKRFMVRTAEGDWTLNHHEAKAWLWSLAQLELYILLGVEMTSGAPMRMTELVSALIRNRPTRIRNVMGIGRYLAIIRQYTKNTNNEQMDRLIPCSPCGLYTDLLIQLHTFARPLAVVSDLLSRSFPDLTHSPSSLRNLFGLRSQRLQSTTANSFS